MYRLVYSCIRNQTNSCLKAPDNLQSSLTPSMLRSWMIWSHRLAATPPLCCNCIQPHRLVQDALHIRQYTSSVTTMQRPYWHWTFAALPKLLLTKQALPARLVPSSPHSIVSSPLPSESSCTTGKWCQRESCFSLADASVICCTEELQDFGAMQSTAVFCIEPIKAD